MKRQVNFLTVQSPQEKIRLLCQTAQRAFNQQKRLQFIVPSPEALNYLDELLWKLPQESFLPHAIVQAPSELPIVITQEHSNFNGAEIIFNLCPESTPLAAKVPYTYELLEKNVPEKVAQARIRWKNYQQMGCECHN